jgi:hypothetical protein
MAAYEGGFGHLHFEPEREPIARTFALDGRVESLALIAGPTLMDVSFVQSFCAPETLAGLRRV